MIILGRFLISSCRVFLSVTIAVDIFLGGKAQGDNCFPEAVVVDVVAIVVLLVGDSQLLRPLIRPSFFIVEAEGGRVLLLMLLL